MLWCCDVSRCVVVCCCVVHVNTPVTHFFKQVSLAACAGKCAKNILTQTGFCKKHVVFPCPESSRRRGHLFEKVGVTAVSVVVVVRW